MPSYLQNEQCCLAKLLKYKIIIREKLGNTMESTSTYYINLVERIIQILRFFKKLGCNITHNLCSSHRTNSWPKITTMIYLSHYQRSEMKETDWNRFCLSLPWFRSNFVVKKVTYTALSAKNLSNSLPSLQIMVYLLHQTTKEPNH